MKLELRIKTFWENVSILSNNECWKWRASFTKEGYGTSCYKGKAILAHRLAYILTFGNIPEGMIICHRCDNKKCCNPQHLFAGTYSENTRDMYQKGRAVVNSGSNHGLSKLTESDILEIRQLAFSGMAQYKIAKQFNVNQSQISRAINKKRWRHVL